MVLAMRRLVIAVIAALVLSSSAAFAHQPVVLLDTDLYKVWTKESISGPVSRGRRIRSPIADC